MEAGTNYNLKEAINLAHYVPESNSHFPLEEWENKCYIGANVNKLDLPFSRFQELAKKYRDETPLIELLSNGLIEIHANRTIPFNPFKRIPNTVWLVLLSDLAYNKNRANLLVPFFLIVKKDY